MKNSFFSQFTPKEPKFFPLLKQLSEVLCGIGRFFQFMHDLLYFDKFNAILFLFEKFGDKEFIYIIRLVLDFMQFGTVFTEKSRFLTECFEFVHGFAYIDRFLLNQTAQLFAIL